MPRTGGALGDVDLTLPRPPDRQAALHPLTIDQDAPRRSCGGMGFALAEGPEIETEFHCFDALNTPADHPARNEKDTFYFDSGKLLRTHTSTRADPHHGIAAAPGAHHRPGLGLPPRRDRRHPPLGLQPARGALRRRATSTLPDLKGTLEYFFQALFGEDTEVRFRPHFFPFTEPSFEIDVRLHIKGQKPRWIEIAGCGMVDPAVFEAICQSRGDEAYDPDKVTGFAFGMGLDRLAMIKWGIKDIRLLIENDARFLAQFA